MADVKYGQNVDFQNNEARNMRIQLVNGLPAATAAKAGWVVFNTADSRFYYCTGSAWENKATDSDLLGGQNGAYYRARGNHTGTQTASTISDFATAVQALRWQSMLPPNAVVDMGGQRVTNAVDGVAATDLATVQQVQAVATQVDYKASVRLASSVNIAAISGLLVIDSIQTVAGNRVLLTAQTNPVQNGIYVVAAGAWARAADADGVGELSGGTVVPVEEGTTNADTLWLCTTNGAITPGTDANAWTKYGASQGEVGIAGAGLTKTGTTYDVGSGDGIVVSADSIAVDRTTVPKIVTGLLGNGSASITIAHNLGKKAVIPELYETTSGDSVITGVTRTDNNNVTFNLSATPAASNTYTYVIIG